MDPEDLAREMAAARERRAEKTAQQLRDSRVHAIRSAIRPGSSRQEVEERARSFYPGLSPDLIEEAVDLVCGGGEARERKRVADRPALDRNSGGS